MSDEKTTKHGAATVIASLESLETILRKHREFMAIAVPNKVNIIPDLLRDAARCVAGLRGSALESEIVSVAAFVHDAVLKITESMAASMIVGSFAPPAEKATDAPSTPANTFVKKKDLPS